MILKVFSVRDDKAALFMSPFFFSAVGQAVRAFSDLVNDASSMVGRHPEDFGLFEIGAFDDNSGKLESLPAPKLLGRASDFKTPAAEVKPLRLGA